MAPKHDSPKEHPSPAKAKPKRRGIWGLLKEKFSRKAPWERLEGVDRLKAVMEDAEEHAKNDIIRGIVQENPQELYNLVDIAAYGADYVGGPDGDMGEHALRMLRGWVDDTLLDASRNGMDMQKLMAPLVRLGYRMDTNLARHVGYASAWEKHKIASYHSTILSALSHIFPFQQEILSIDAEVYRKTVDKILKESLSQWPPFDRRSVLIAASYYCRYETPMFSLNAPRLMDFLLFASKETDISPAEPALVVAIGSRDEKPAKAAAYALAVYHSQKDNNEMLDFLSRHHGRETVRKAVCEILESRGAKAENAK